VDWRWSGPPELEVLAHPVRRADGAEQTWHLPRAQGGAPGAVCIARHEGRLAVGRPWRLPLGGQTVELIRGFGEPGEDAGETGRRGLLEETGLVADVVRVVGSLYADSGMLGNRIDVVELSVADPVPGGYVDGELASWRWIDEGEIDELVDAGEVVDGITLAGAAAVAAPLLSGQRISSATMASMAASMSSAMTSKCSSAMRYGSATSSTPSGAFDSARSRARSRGILRHRSSGVPRPASRSLQG
jgi:8-oxo-dGTP pyrophosphatase MutT (NUDIX family)